MSKQQSPLISVIIPCYNVSDFVEKAINSILCQTYNNLEIWIIDDGSTDDTLKKINAIKDKRIKVATFVENTQKIGAVNEVLKKVNGNFIAFQDADDWSEPDRIKMQLQQFTIDLDLGICFTGYNCIGTKTFLPEKIALTNEDLRHEFLDYTYQRAAGTSPTCCPTMMISRAALETTGGYHPYFAGRVAEDIQWIYRILKYFKGITVNEILYNYTLRNGSFSHIQSEGSNAKYAYSWQLLSKIVHKDINEGIDVLKPEHSDLLKKLEMEACEEALSEKIKELNDLRKSYEQSARYRIGKFLLAPWTAARKKLKF